MICLLILAIDKNFWRNADLPYLILLQLLPSELFLLFPSSGKEILATSYFSLPPIKHSFFSLPCRVSLPMGTVLHPPLPELLAPASAELEDRWYILSGFCVFSEPFMGLCKVNKVFIINVTLVLPTFQPEEYCKRCFSGFGAIGIRGSQKNQNIL